MAGEDISSKNTACDWPAGRGLAPAVGAVPQPGAEQGEPSEWDRARGQGALGGARSASLPPRQINPPREGEGGGKVRLLAFHRVTALSRSYRIVTYSSCGKVSKLVLKKSKHNVSV